MSPSSPTPRSANTTPTANVNPTTGLATADTTATTSSPATNANHATADTTGTTSSPATNANHATSPKNAGVFTEGFLTAGNHAAENHGPENHRAENRAATSPSPEPKRTLTAEGTNREAFTRKDWILLAVPGFIWGASFLQIAESLEGFTPAAVTFGRMLFGFLTLAFVPSARRTKIPRSAWPQLFAVAVTWLAFPMTLFPIAQQHISSSLAGMLNGGIPIFTAIFATILLRRLPGINQRYALLGGIAGLAMIGLPSINEGKSSAFGVLLVLIAIASYGIAVNLSVPLTQAYGAIPVFWRCQLIAVVLTAPLGIPGMFKSDFGMRPSLFLVSLGILGTAVAFVCMVTLAARVGATRGSILTYVEAVIALALGVVFRHEKVRAIEVAGCSVILGAAWLAGRADT